MSTYRLKFSGRKQSIPKITQGDALKRKRRLLLDTRRTNLARATQHLTSLEKVARNPIQAEQYARARKEMISIAESLPR